MKAQIFLFALPALVFSAPEAKPEPAAEPQLSGLIPLAVGGLTLGAIGSAAAGIGSAALGAASGAVRDCECARYFQPPPCSGSWVSRSINFSLILILASVSARIRRR